MTYGKKIGRYSSRRRKSKPNIPGSSYTDEIQISVSSVVEF